MKFLAFFAFCAMVPLNVFASAMPERPSIHFHSADVQSRQEARMEQVQPGADEHAHPGDIFHCDGGCIVLMATEAPGLHPRHLPLGFRPPLSLLLEGLMPPTLPRPPKA
ncbi:hypothetical protein EET67_21690 [Pseudaminobacter arsenicus]|uniref:DUF2946 domain-containing protein n=1 Tax=Borborobacter arsenicus TaxID=1851146 RepID=A0A432V0Q0_9HYPH|nr:hypothetical protein [Pseudaminobacter arsenicus]RUM95740.1 hypothetical protein EET67_21690 [Pseudaminobacter arsenicus]